MWVAGKAAACDANITCGHQLHSSYSTTIQLPPSYSTSNPVTSQLLHFQSSYIPATPLPIQFSANGLGKAVGRWSKGLGSLSPAWQTENNSLAPVFSQIQLWLLGPFRSEPTDGKSLSVSPSLSLCNPDFQIDIALKKHKFPQRKAQVKMTLLMNFYHACEEFNTRPFKNSWKM